MIKPKLHRGVSESSRKKSSVPLCKLRASEAIRTVVNHPRRLEELIGLLRDKERSIRGRASATVARFSETHPARLVRHVDRLREALEDDSAYVRWHALYALGQVISRFPSRTSFSLPDIKSRLGDEDKLVRLFACRALEAVAAHKPIVIKEFFAGHPDEMPPSLAGMIQAPPEKSDRSSKKGR
jgi:hypothetical protein